MPKTVIAIDIDEVLSPFLEGLIPWHNRQYNTTYQLRDFYTYEYDKVWGGNREQAIDKSTEHFENRGSIEPLSGATRVIARLSKDYDLIVVTSRMLKHKLQTEAWIQDHFPGVFKEILICNHWTKDNQGPVIKKSAACLQHEAHYLIDDLPLYIEDVVNAGLIGLLFGNYPWNQKIPAHQAIKRMPDWQAVEDYFYQSDSVLMF